MLNFVNEKLINGEYYKLYRYDDRPWINVIILNDTHVEVTDIRSLWNDEAALVALFE